MYVVAGTLQSVSSYLVQQSELGNQFWDEGSNVRGGSATATVQLDVRPKDVGHDTTMYVSLYIHMSVTTCNVTHFITVIPS
jgi:hypothetical protein